MLRSELLFHLLSNSRAKSSSRYKPYVQAVSRGMFLSLLPMKRRLKQYHPLICPICLGNPKDMAFQCGHQTSDCGVDLEHCPICRSTITTRI
ncbi:hypothetical protein Pfo_024281, partial [Paulownia fortunei]